MKGKVIDAFGREVAAGDVILVDNDHSPRWKVDSVGPVDMPGAPPEARLVVCTATLKMVCRSGHPMEKAYIVMSAEEMKEPRKIHSPDFGEVRKFGLN